MALKAFLGSIILFLMTANFCLAEQREEIRIGAALALSRFSSSFGEGELNGLNMAVSEVNQSPAYDFKLAVTIEDCQSSNQTVLTALNKLINVDGLKIIIGPTWLDSYQTGLPLVEKSDAVLITPSAAAFSYQSEQKIWPRVFSTSINFLNETQLIAAHLKSLKTEKIALFYDEDPFNVMLFKDMEKSLLKSNPMLKLEIRNFSLDEDDFKSELIKARKNQLEAIIYNFGSESALHAFLKQRRELAPNIKLIGTDFAGSYGERPEISTLMEDVIFPEPAIKDAVFTERYQNKFGIPPGVSSSYAYDAVMILANALKSGARTPDEIDSHLRQNQFLTVSFGPTNFNKMGGVDAGIFVLKQFQSGKKIPVGK